MNGLVLKRLFWLLVLGVGILVAGVSLAGCSSPTVTSTPTSRAEFSARSKCELKLEPDSTPTEEPPPHPTPNDVSFLFLLDASQSPRLYCGKERDRLQLLYPSFFVRAVQDLMSEKSEAVKVGVAIFGMKNNPFYELSPIRPVPKIDHHELKPWEREIIPGDDNYIGALEEGGNLIRNAGGTGVLVMFTDGSYVRDNLASLLEEYRSRLYVVLLCPDKTKEADIKFWRIHVPDSNLIEVKEDEDPGWMEKLTDQLLKSIGIPTSFLNWISPGSHEIRLPKEATKIPYSLQVKVNLLQTSPPAKVNGQDVSSSYLLGSGNECDLSVDLLAHSPGYYYFSGSYISPNAQRFEIEMTKAGQHFQVSLRHSMAFPDNIPLDTLMNLTKCFEHPFPPVEGKTWTWDNTRCGTEYCFENGGRLTALLRIEDISAPHKTFLSPDIGLPFPFLVTGEIVRSEKHPEEQGWRAFSIRIYSHYNLNRSSKEDGIEISMKTSKGEKELNQQSSDGGRCPDPPFFKIEKKNYKEDLFEVKWEDEESFTLDVDERLYSNCGYNELVFESKINRGQLNCDETLSCKFGGEGFVCEQGHQGN